MFLKSGRNVNLWAGYDLILRAKNSIDGSASAHDVRLKAENNMMLLGGNSGTGGVLVESRGASGNFDFSQSGEAVSFGGVILRASRGQSSIGPVRSLPHWRRRFAGRQHYTGRRGGHLGDLYQQCHSR